ncbi:SMP-30 protein-like protein [Coleophoma crateriformis]|uniref:SMP-30 protein-like protein n=1 Tax=Coleophoma crateriformis TaxID=565419 RepID=A0A3D8SLV4_9HELO|nr:SMP-30 protein-like protein [Coleophoma crateriformis]
MAEFKTWTVTKPYINLHCALGEAPYYEPSTNTLRFVDIKKKRLHTLSLSAPIADPENPGDALHTLELDTPVGVTADIEGVDPSQKILVGYKRGVAVLDRKTGQYELLKRFYDSEANDERLRSNDGTVDAQGRFWIGTMNDFWVGAPQAEGNLFRFSSDLARSELRSGLIIPNGIGWSLDEKTLYFTHSAEHQIYAFDYAPSTGDISNERVFYKHPTKGEPDGFAIDVEGNLWQCVYGEGKVLRINPKGEVTGEIKMPCSNITCPAFMGTELWITTAAEEGEELSGGLFKVDVGVAGLPPNQFKADEVVLKKIL